MLYIFYFADLQQIFKINKIIYNALSNNGLDFFCAKPCVAFYNYAPIADMAL